jgi:hypothetical protein
VEAAVSSRPLWEDDLIPDSRLSNLAINITQEPIFRLWEKGGLKE